MEFLRQYGGRFACESSYPRSPDPGKSVELVAFSEGRIRKRAPFMLHQSDVLRPS